MSVLILSLLFCSGAAAQTDLTGTWQGKLAASPNEQLIIQFILAKQANGTYAAVVNSPDTGGVKNVPATVVKFVGGILTIDVASLSGSYSGTVGKGVITGQWKQENRTLPLVLTAYRKPDASTLKPLVGDWVGSFEMAGQGKATALLHFDMTRDGKFFATADLPQSGEMGIPLTDIRVEGSQVRCRVANSQVEYTGKRTGNRIEGAIRQGIQGPEVKMDLVKGKYEAPGIDMPAEAMKLLLGQWVGKYTPGETYTVLWKFEKTKDGKLTATAAAPEAGAQVYPVSDISLKGDQLNFKIPGTKGEYTGKLDNNSLTGTYRINGAEFPVHATRGGKPELPVTKVDMPAETLKKLMGRWNGNVGPQTVVFRFERNAEGKIIVLQDILDQNIKGMLVLKASMTDSYLSMKMPDGATLSLKLNGNKLDGNLKSNQTNLAVSLTREQAAGTPAHH
jgi:hypothetical protein